MSPNSKHVCQVLETQRQLCLSAIKDIESSAHAVSCDAHVSLAHGVTALLHSQVAAIELTQQIDHNSKTLFQSILVRLIPHVLTGITAGGGAVWAMVKLKGQ